MKEVKPSQKPLAIYYAIVLLVLLVLNIVLVPWLSERQIKEVDYGTFMTITGEEFMDILNRPEPAPTEE